MLFSEPKILNFINRHWNDALSNSFSALQRAENSQLSASSSPSLMWRAVSVLFSEPKILNGHPHNAPAVEHVVSVLFSEPKILNRPRENPRFGRFLRFSALQRAENSQSRPRRSSPSSTSSFSALQRAENSQSRPSHLRPSIFPTAMITLRHS